jgi:hypothetical protein
VPTVTLPLVEKYSYHLVNGFPFVLRNALGVDIHCRGNIAVPEQFLLNGQSCTKRMHQTGKGMSEEVPADLSDWPLSFARK